MPTLKLHLSRWLNVIALITTFISSSLFFAIECRSQSLDVSSCGAIEKRNNGNGQSARSAGNFTGFGQNNPVAANVVGTAYQNVAYDPSLKTGNIIFRWNSATTIN